MLGERATAMRPPLSMNMPAIRSIPHWRSDALGDLHYDGDTTAFAGGFIFATIVDPVQIELAGLTLENHLLRFANNRRRRNMQCDRSDFSIRDTPIPSWAEFTLSDPGWLYVMANGNLVKIGKTHNPERRIRDARTWIPDGKVIMPAYGKLVPADEDRWRIVQYVRTLGPGH